MKHDRSLLVADIFYLRSVASMPAVRMSFDILYLTISTIQTAVRMTYDILYLQRGQHISDSGPHDICCLSNQDETEPWTNNGNKKSPR
jgi:hypothetical protein